MPIKSDPLDVIAGQVLFRVAEKHEARLRDSAQVRHMLYWLGCVLDDIASDCCASCGRELPPPTWESEAEARAEARELFGYEIPEEQRERLCDPCYEQFTVWVKSLPASAREQLDRETLEPSARANPPGGQ